jgi:molecular chaperone HtpG
MSTNRTKTHAAEMQRPETHAFQAEVQELLGLVIHSLYKHREIFLRELVSNASDAIDKLRVESLTRPELSAEGAGKIRIEVDRDARTLSVVDDGIGMSHDELVSHLGTIARSGTRAFLDKLKSAGAAAPELIGQFGVGFYSSFMVADEVVVDTRRAGEDQAWRWRSGGKGEYSIETLDAAEAGLGAHGTRVRLHLREKGGDEEEDPGDFLDEHTIREVVKRYSDFVTYPIQMEVTKDGKAELVTLNSMKPLWSRPKDDVKREEYDEFYRHLTHDWTPPREVIHFKVEGTLEFTALLFVPAHRPMDLFEPGSNQSRLSLYVRRVLIMEEAPELLPPWLRFVRGLVDSPDLPLNVSRDVLQASPAVRAIKKRLVKRVIESLATMLEQRREEYRAFWKDFGAVLKEGIWHGDAVASGAEEGALAKLLLFESTHASEPATPGKAATRSDSTTGSDSATQPEPATRAEPATQAEPTTLAEYRARMKPDQKAIWYLAGDSRALLEGSPHLEAFRKRGLEVLFFTDPIDEWLLQRMREFDGVPLQPIDRGDLAIESPSEKEAREKLDRENRDVLAAIESRLTERVRTARFTTRLTESPAAMVDDEHALSAHMERLLRAANQDVPQQKRILELNPDHALVKRLIELHASDPRSERFADLVDLIHGQALLQEGSTLPDAARFARLVTKLVSGANGGA